MCTLWTHCSFPCHYVPQPWIIYRTTEVFSITNMRLNKGRNNCKTALKPFCWDQLVYEEQSRDRLIFNMGIPILVRYLNIEIAPCFAPSYYLKCVNCTKKLQWNENQNAPFFRKCISNVQLHICIWKLVYMHLKVRTYALKKWHKRDKK